MDIYSLYTNIPQEEGIAIVWKTCKTFYESNFRFQLTSSEKC